jgi:hypothetical protein
VATKKKKVKKTVKKASASSKKAAAAKKTGTKAKKPAAKSTAVKKASAKKATAKKATAKKATAKKAPAKKGAAKKATASKAPGKKVTVKKVTGKKVTVKAVAKAPAKNAASAKAKPASKKKPAAKIQVTNVSSTGKVVAGKAAPVKVETPAPPAKGGLGMRSQPVEVQAIDVRMGRAKDSRLPEYLPRSYGKAPKKPTVKGIQESLSKVLGRCPTPPVKDKGFTLVEIGIFSIFAIGRTSARDAAEATKRVVKAFPDWNEFRISDAFELVEILDDLKIDSLFDRCEQVLEFVNEVYNDQNFVDLEYLRELPVEDRLALLGRFQSIPSSMTHYLALAIQDFEGFLFHYSWARVVQRVGIVPRSGSPKTLVASASKIFHGLDSVTLQVQLIDLGDEICLPKNPHCKTCYLVLQCKARKV